MKEANKLIENFKIEAFCHDLINWYKQEKRDLPWRLNQDPYRVWVSEIMLQQTKVDTVIPYYERFMHKFPSLLHFAEADEESVLKAWEGLGYYSRVRNLHSAVKEVQETYGGQVPSTKEEVSALKGVGPYTTGAILSIAFDKPEPAVDGNVMRVMSRVLSIWEDIAKPKTRKLFEEVIYQVISQEDPSSFNQGLMELGALICTPTSPSCLLCPVQKHCRAFEEGVQTDLPVKSKKTPPRYVPMIAGFFTTEDGRLLIHKRANQGLLAKLWEFPNIEATENSGRKEDQLATYMKEVYGLDVTIEEYVTNIQHVFSHLIWDITVYRGKILGHVEERQDILCVTKEETEHYAFPVSHQKIYKECTGLKKK
jgi:A/G-specific adenine glycosylase